MKGSRIKPGVGRAECLAIEHMRAGVEAHHSQFALVVFLGFQNFVVACNNFSI
jgi:hypothetical protein